jgi:hypothetical protein
MTPTVDIIESLLSGFNPSTAIKTITDNLNGTITVTVCDTLNLREDLTFTLNLVTYKVISISGNSVTFATATLPLKGDLIFPKKPFYFHGTPIATGNELAIIGNSTDKLPMVYLLEIIQDSFPNELTSSIDRETTVRLFFLDEANFEDWDTDQHYSQAIQPQANYALAFRKYLQNHRSIGLLQGSTDLIYRAKFGLSVTQNGVSRNLFAENLSGVEMELTLPIKKSLDCLC